MPSLVKLLIGLLECLAPFDPPVMADSTVSLKQEVVDGFMDARLELKLHFTSTATVLSCVSDAIKEWPKPKE